MYFNPKKIEDFLAEESFVQWVKNPDESTNLFWHQWCLMHPEFEKEVLTAKNIILGINYNQSYELTQNEVADMFTAIKQFERRISEKETEEANKTANRMIPIGRQLFWIAAASILIMIVSILGWQLWTSREMQEITHKMERRTIVLPDGSVVTLNSQSQLTFPAAFGGDKREVTLNGEAFFEIVKDPSHPFVIHSGKMETTVLGTSFNLIATEKNHAVAVVTGKVKVQSRDNSAILLPNQMGILDAQGLSITKNSFNLRKVTGWKDGILLFEQDNFDYVFQMLEQWYGVTVIIKPNTILKGRYSGEFRNESLENVLTGIAFTSHFQFKIEKEKVIISN